MPGEIRRRGEFALIAEVLAPLAGDDARSLCLKDDAAVLPQRSETDVVVTTDTMVSGIHFLATEPPGIVARRLLRVNISDLAAMGAAPAGYFLNLTLSDDIDDAWLEAFADGLRTDQDEYGIRLLGGDTTHTPGPLTLSVTALGNLPAGTAILRSGARPGDLVMVSGTIGDAVLGLSALQAGDDDAESVARYQLPQPRIRLGVGLRGIATAMADVSDGLAADLGHICGASGLAATLQAAKVPLSDAVRRALDVGRMDIRDVLGGGDDYELVFTVPPDRRAQAVAASDDAGVAVGEIGRMEEAAGGVRVIGLDGREIALGRTGYTHF